MQRVVLTMALVLFATENCWSQDVSVPPPPTSEGPYYEPSLNAPPAVAPPSYEDVRPAAPLNVNPVPADQGTHRSAPVETAPLAQPQSTIPTRPPVVTPRTQPLSTAPDSAMPYPPAPARSLGYAAPVWPFAGSPAPGVVSFPPALVPLPEPVDGIHLRYPYYSYRRPWYTPGQASLNVTLIW